MIEPWKALLQLRAWWPAAPNINRREAARVAIGAALGLFVAGGLSMLSGLGTPWLVAPLGASAVLVFGVPSSPLAQPWSVVGGNTISSLAAVAVMQMVPQALPAAALAAGVAIALMIALRCLHPPGGASALLTVLAGANDWHFALFPILANSLLLVAVGVIYNRLTGRSYPHIAHPSAQPTTAPARRFSDADIDAVLARHNQLMHTPRDELQELLEEAEVQAMGRRLRELRCADIMSRNPVTVTRDTPLPAAWALLRSKGIKALPVIDASHQVVGIVTQADFLRDAKVDVREGPDGRVQWHVVTPVTGAPHAPAQINQLMTRRVRVASRDRSLADVVPVFSDTGHHHIPVIDAAGRLVGILTQTDVVRALRRFADPAPDVPNVPDAQAAQPGSPAQDARTQ
jgi:CBS domain-containing membrane protein